MECPKCGSGRSGPHPSFCRPIDRFWRKVDRSGECWIWKGATNGRYGQMRLGRKHLVFAHRWIYEQVNRGIGSGLVVMHSCDTTLCVRPDHLKIGTQQDNLRDSYNKGRMPQWEKST